MSRRNLGRCLLAVCLLGCGDNGPACDNGACDSDASVGDGGDAGDTGTDGPPTCDPKTQNCIDASKGVFVATNGNDSNDGSQQNPVLTIGTGIAKAKAAGKPNVYVCAGSYAENVDIKDAVALLGGFSCTDWTYSTASVVTIAPSSGLPLRIESATTSISDVKFVAANATNAGDSSIAAFASNASVTLLRDDLEAGAGMSATQPAAQADFSPSQAASGKNGDGSNGGGQSMVTCTNGSGTTTGGAGGPPTAPGADGFNGAPFSSYPVNPTLADGAAGTHGGTCATGLGHNGSYGPGGAAGAGATKLGTFDATGWAPGGGGAGGIGDVGEGGGGGASLDSSGGGGGGGPGGCGGVGGTGASGGGASIVLLSFNSNLTLTQTTLVAKNAGDGAKGGTGQKAQGGGGSGGAGGTAGIDACSSGAGGHGGSGGGGGGGAGGVSAGILYSGSAPTIDGAPTASADTLATVTLGTSGAAGAGGDGGAAYKTTAPASNAGTNGSSGPAGVAKAVMQAP